MKDCDFCRNHHTDKKLNRTNDLHAERIGLGEPGYAIHIRTGMQFSTAILFSVRSSDSLDVVASYIPRYCPECGRLLTENEPYRKQYKEGT